MKIIGALLCKSHHSWTRNYDIFLSQSKENSKTNKKLNVLLKPRAVLAVGNVTVRDAKQSVLLCKNLLRCYACMISKQSNAIRLHVDPDEPPAFYSCFNQTDGRRLTSAFCLRLVLHCAQENNVCAHIKKCPLHSFRVIDERSRTGGSFLLHHCRLEPLKSGLKLDFDWFGFLSQLSENGLATAPGAQQFISE